MVIVAVLLLPLLAALLVVMDRVEERLFGAGSDRPRHAGHRRHLRLVPGGRQNEPAAPEAGPAAAEHPAA